MSDFALCFLFAAEPCINQREDANWRSIIRLRLHNLLLLRTNRAECGARFILVLLHPRKQAAPKAGLKRRRVGAKQSAFAEYTKRGFGCRRITFRQGTDEPDIGDALHRLGIFGANLIDRLVERSSVGFPIEESEATCSLGLRVISFDRQRAIQRGNLLSIPMQKLVAECELLKGEEVPWVQFHRVLKIAHSLLLRASAAGDISSQFEDPGSVGQCAADDAELSQRAVVITICLV